MRGSENVVAIHRRDSLEEQCLNSEIEREHAAAAYKIKTISQRLLLRCPNHVRAFRPSQAKLAAATEPRKLLSRSDDTDR